MSLPRAGWNTGLLFCKKSWHLQKFVSAENWAIFPLKRKICGEGRKGKKSRLEKSNHSYSFFFPPMQNRGTAASVSWGSLQPRAEQPQIPASRCLHQSSRGFGLAAAELSPAGAERDSPHSSITSSRRGTNPAATDLLLQPNFGFISLLVLGQKVCFTGNSSLAFLDTFACYTVTPRVAT